MKYCNLICFLLYPALFIHHYTEWLIYIILSLQSQRITNFSINAPFTHVLPNSDLPPYLWFRLHYSLLTLLKCFELDIISFPEHIKLTIKFYVIICNVLLTFLNRHVFLGFTKCGQFVLSYTHSCDTDDHTLQMIHR